MSTSIKVREADKARLDRLQAELTARAGAKVTQQDLVAGLLDLGERRVGELAPRKRRRAGSMRRLMSLPVHAGASREEDIDRDLYDEQAR